MRVVVTVVAPLPMDNPPFYQVSQTNVKLAVLQDEAKGHLLRGKEEV